ncbi:MAG: glycosyltransferase family 39 protein, partial [Chloroflexota bacterium]
MLDNLKPLVNHHKAATAIALLFFIIATTYSIINPLFEASDEVWHYPFVWQLARTGQLPVQDPANVQLWRQEASQPPLYYAVAALLTASIPNDDLPSLIYRNPHADIGVVTPDRNTNIIIHTDREQWPWRGSVLGAHITRIFSVLLSTGSILTLYAIGRLIWPENKQFALLTMMFAAFNPMFLFISSSVNNDNAITFIAALLIWQLIHLMTMNPPFSTKRFAILGGLVGLAALSKVSGLGLLGLTGLTIFWQGWRQRSWHIAFGGNTIMTVTALIIAGWWYWRNFTLYGDLTGTSIMVAMMGARVLPPTPGQLLGEVPGLMRSFWGLFGGLSVAFPNFI